jgi:hypothetical protein
MQAAQRQDLSLVLGAHGRRARRDTVCVEERGNRNIIFDRDVLWLRITKTYG